MPRTLWRTSAGLALCLMAAIPLRAQREERKEELARYVQRVETVLDIAKQSDDELQQVLREIQWDPGNLESALKDFRTARGKLTETLGVLRERSSDPVLALSTLATLHLVNAATASLHGMIHTDDSLLLTMNKLPLLRQRFGSLSGRLKTLLEETDKTFADGFVLTAALIMDEEARTQRQLDACGAKNRKPK